MGTLASYLVDLREIRATGMAVKETSFYPALRDLFENAGRTLKPRVRCVMQLTNRGAGFPDGGLYTPDQLRSAEHSTPMLGQIPSRGVIEAKGASDSLNDTVNSEQVARYLAEYGLVIVTNLREFAVVIRGEDGQAEIAEEYSLAPSEAAFWSLAAGPIEAENQQGDLFTDFLQRALLHATPLADPRDVAFYLASFARDARTRLERLGGTEPSSLREALEAGLGIKFEGERGERFLRSTLVQTLFYGMFSAWVLWARDRSRKSDYFEWRSASWYLRVPVIQALFEELVRQSQVTSLGLVEVLDGAGSALNRIDTEAFFKRFEDSRAVQYFYEPFLAEFDPTLRKDLGVWYTPPEVVTYMVERVDNALRKQLGVADGLADPRVHVLDPCTGTGSYVVAVLERITTTLKARGDGALIAAQVKAAAVERIHGFEILPAPFVVAHLQVGLLLQRLGAPLDGLQERASIYLTNALTDWSNSKDEYVAIKLPPLAAERDAAEQVKQNDPILVVIGNPPYNAFAGVVSEAEGSLVDVYKAGLNSPTSSGGWGIKKYNLDDLYVRFFRIAERRIAEHTGQGIVCYITNYSYLSDPSFVVMRERLLREFDYFYIDSLNGDSRETGKTTPDGKPDPSIFSTESNKAGIRVGTAISLLVRTPERRTEPVVRYREFWGSNKRGELLQSLEDPADSGYESVWPAPELRYLLRKAHVHDHYLEWPKLTDFPRVSPSNGLMEKRGGALIDIDRNRLEYRMRRYFDPAVSWAELQALETGLTRDAAGYMAESVRSKLLKSQSFDASKIQRYLVRPFDDRWAYVSTVPPLWNRARPTLVAQAWQGNSFLISRLNAANSDEGRPMFFARALTDDHLLAPDASSFPFYFREKAATPESSIQPTFEAMGLKLNDESISSNLSPRCRAYLRSLGFDEPAKDSIAVESVWMHSLAIGFSPAYLSENADGIRVDWPRIPLPRDPSQLLASAELGRQVAELLDTEKEVVGITAGTLPDVFQTLAHPMAVDGKQLNPTVDFRVNAGWGSGGRNKPVMPGIGKALQREFSDHEATALRSWQNRLCLEVDANLPLGAFTYDVFLNEQTFWSNVPARVWDYTIGGYQVIKKWLSYREFSILDRPLTLGEVREVQNMVRRIAAILLLEPKLDVNYLAVRETTYHWPDASPKQSRQWLWADGDND